MDVTLVFDVEDPITPESDDVAKWLAEVLTAEGATGTFFVTGAKARALEERGREDVIDAIARHDVAYHSDTHSVHPTMAEYVAGEGWEGGVAETKRREREGLADVERIFGVRPRAFGRTGGSYAPQVAAALSDLGLAYAYSPVALESNVCRYAGALTFGMHTRGFDAALAEDDAFEERLAWHADHLAERAAAGADWVGVFGAHPTRVRATEFWDAVNFAGGENTPEGEREPPELRPESEMGTARANFRRLVRFLQGNDFVDLRTVRDLADRHAGQVDAISRGDLAAHAAAIAESGELPVDRALSPAEALVALAEAVTHHDAHGGLPDRVERTDVLGPVTDPPRDPGPDVLAPGVLAAAADDLLAIVAETGHVPDAVAGGVGIGSFAVALAEAVVSIARTDALEPVELRAVDPFPAIADEVEERVPEVLAGWPIHDPDLDPSGITAHSVRQTWTLKPAGPG